MLCGRCVQKSGTARAWGEEHPRSDRSTSLHDLMELYTKRVEAKQHQNGIPLRDRQRTVPWRVLPSIFKSVYHPEYLQYSQISADDTLGRQLSQLPPGQMEDVTGIMFGCARRTCSEEDDEKEEGEEDMDLIDVEFPPTIRNSFDGQFTESHMSSPASNSTPMTSFRELNYIDHPENMDLLYDLKEI
ncbi:uncharacterized protein L199_001678 [Kwoniella botswanensis]|uniref:uncharacterized protein n=1 Tax=Kwoniella botswanensis TaxID=1268659 RepID=UPI00315DFBA8